MTKEAKIIVSITIVVVIAIVAFMALSPQGSAVTGSSVDLSRLATSTSHMTGKLGAKVTVVEFGDYQCPACGEMNPFIDQLIATYGKNPDFNFVFRNFPLPQHPNAMIAAEAAEAAGAQGKFWEMHDLLYANQNDWADSTTPINFFTQYAKQLGLNVAKFTADVENNTYQDFILADQADGDAVDVQWTPSIFVNGELEQPTANPDDIKSKIDALLSK